MGILEFIIKKYDVADDAEAIGEDGELVGITEMAVDVELSGVGDFGEAAEVAEFLTEP